MSFNIAPKPLATIALFTIAALLMLNIYISTQQPTLGIVWGANSQGNLYIERVFSGSPAEKAQLQAGKTIVAMGAGTLSQPLTAFDLTDEPDNLGTYDKVDDFFHHQEVLYRILNHNQVWLETESGQRFTLEPSQRQLSWLPMIYWFQLGCGLLSFLAGMAVFSFRTQSRATQVYALNGLSFTIVTFAAAIYSGRELAIAGDLFRGLSALNHLGSLWFTATFLAIAWHVPQTFKRFPITRVLLTVFSLFWLADTLRWQAQSPENWVQLPILAGLLSTFILAGLQWRKSFGEPADRQALRWLLLSLLLPGILFVSLTILLQWLGIELILPQGYAFGILLVMYIGISLGVTRLALFELDQWWNTIWLWLLTGIGFIAVDISLASVLHLSETITTLTSIIIMGFIYLPLRQLIVSKVQKKRVSTIEQVIPSVLKMMKFSDKPNQLEQAWKKILQQMFEPLSLKEIASTPRHAMISEHGLQLIIPNIGLGTAWVASYPNQGARLFNQDDLVLINSLIQIVKKALADAQQYQQAVVNERQRMAEDLHDDLGAKILSLVYKSETPEQKELARQAMNTLREVISSSQDEHQLLIDQALAWKKECAQRALEKDVHLVWQQHGLQTHQSIPSQLSIPVIKVLREALSNALKHGHGDSITVRIYLRDHLLYMSVHNGGSAFCDTSIQGKGRLNMKRRIENIGGKIRWRSGKRGGCHVAWAIPL